MKKRFSRFFQIDITSSDINEFWIGQKILKAESLLLNLVAIGVIPRVLVVPGRPHAAPVRGDDFLCPKPKIISKILSPKKISPFFDGLGKLAKMPPRFSVARIFSVGVMDEFGKPSGNC